MTTTYPIRTAAPLTAAQRRLKQKSRLLQLNALRALVQAHKALSGWLAHVKQNPESWEGDGDWEFWSEEFMRNYLWELSNIINPLDCCTLDVPSDVRAYVRDSLFAS